MENISKVPVCAVHGAQPQTQWKFEVEYWCFKELYKLNENKYNLKDMRWKQSDLIFQNEGEDEAK